MSIEEATLIMNKYNEIATEANRISNKIKEFQEGKYNKDEAIILEEDVKKLSDQVDEMLKELGSKIDAIEKRSTNPTD